MIMFFGLLVMIGLTACRGAQTAPPTEEPPASTQAAAQVVTETDETPAETPTPAPTFTPTPSPEPTATNTPVATPTPAPTDTPTPEPAPLVRLPADNDSTLNVRSGPGTAYPVVAQFTAGQEAVVTGRNEEGSWWQISLADETNPAAVGWLLAELVTLTGEAAEIAVAEAPPLPTPDPAAVAAAEVEPEGAEAGEGDEGSSEEPATPQEVAEQLKCGKDFCVTYQAMVPIGENGGCVGNHSIYITVLQGPPPGQPLDGVVIGDTFNNVEVGSGSHGPGRTEITLWNNSMTLIAKRHQDGTPYTSQESFNFTAADELIPAEVLAANGYCEGRVDVCEVARNNNSVCRGHYSWRVTFHKLQ